MSIATYPFRPEGTVSLSVTTTSANVALDGSTPFAVRVANTGTATAYMRFGSSSATAVTTDMPILPSTVEVFTVPVGATYLAAITSSSTTSLSITSGGGL